jgi:Holliday junction resolvase RusA-like endonuclease
MWRATVRGKIAVNILSKEGRAWKELAASELKGQPALVGPCYWRADILISSLQTKCDLDNLLKGILDALGAAGKTPDDRYLVDLRIRFHGGNAIKIAIKQEELSKWATIKQTSRSLMKKLGKSSQSTRSLL